MPSSPPTLGLTWRDGSRTLFDCPLCGQAGRVDRHGSRLSLRCFAGCPEHEVAERLDLAALVAELVARAPAPAAPDPVGDSLRAHFADRPDLLAFAQAMSRVLVWTQRRRRELTRKVRCHWTFRWEAAA
jgi:hypothetical protein